MTQKKTPFLSFSKITKLLIFFFLKQVVLIVTYSILLNEKNRCVAWKLMTHSALKVESIIDMDPTNNYIPIHFSKLISNDLK